MNVKIIPVTRMRNVPTHLEVLIANAIKDLKEMVLNAKVLTYVF